MTLRLEANVLRLPRLATVCPRLERKRLDFSLATVTDALQSSFPKILGGQTGQIMYNV